MIPMFPLFRGSTVLQGTVNLIPVCPLFRGSTVLQGTVDLIPMCPLFRGSTVLQGTVDLMAMWPLFRDSTVNAYVLCSMKYALNQCLKYSTITDQLGNDKSELDSDKLQLGSI